VPKDAEALAFRFPALRDGCHSTLLWFASISFAPALKTIGRERCDTTPATTSPLRKTKRVSAIGVETMGRVWHSRAGQPLIYQGHRGRAVTPK